MVNTLSVYGGQASLQKSHFVLSDLQPHRTLSVVVRCLLKDICIAYGLLHSLYGTVYLLEL